MTLGDEEYRELARALLAARPEEIDCEHWLEGVGMYLDHIEGGWPVPESLRPIEEHPRLCPDRAEEYAAMREALGELGESGSRGNPSGA